MKQAEKQPRRTWMEKMAEAGHSGLAEGYLVHMDTNTQMVPEQMALCDKPGRQCVEAHG